MEQFDNPVYNYPIDAVLESLGARQSHKDMYYSPLRDESTASLHIDREKNLWYDHGMGIGGTNVQLVMMTLRCDQKEAEKYISTLSPELAHLNWVKETKPKSEIVKVGPIFSYYLKKYIAARKIPLELASYYCREVTLHNYEKGQNFTLIGFENNAGGFAMKAPSGMKSTNRAGITTINTEGQRTDHISSKTVAVFEGFFDFLSWQVMQNQLKPSCEIVVLNSINNLDKAMDYLGRHDVINCFLDQDDAGRMAQSKIEKTLQGKTIHDMSVLYPKNKDLNEMLISMRGYESKNMNPHKH